MTEVGFSVTMTTKNNGPTIRRSLESILPEVRGRGEVVVVDAHSTDGTWETLTSLATSHPELRAISADLNRGRGRNRAVAESRFPVVLTQVDADNVYREGGLAAAAAAVAAGDRDMLLVEGRADANPACTRVYAWKRAAFDRIGGYPEIQFEEDLVLVQRALHAGLSVDQHLVGNLADDLKFREQTWTVHIPAHRRVPAVVRMARRFHLVGFTYPQYVRFLWLTRRSAVRFGMSSALGAYAYLSPGGRTAEGGRGPVPRDA